MICLISVCIKILNFESKEEVYYVSNTLQYLGVFFFVACILIEFVVLILKVAGAVFITVKNQAKKIFFSPKVIFYWVQSDCVDNLDLNENEEGVEGHEGGHRDKIFEKKSEKKIKVSKFKKNKIGDTNQFQIETTPAFESRVLLQPRNRVKRQIKNNGDHSNNKLKNLNKIENEKFEAGFINKNKLPSENLQETDVQKCEKEHLLDGIPERLDILDTKRLPLLTFKFLSSLDNMEAYDNTPRKKKNY